MTEPTSMPSDQPGQETIEGMAHLEQVLRHRLVSRIHDVQLRLEPHGVVIVGRTASYYDKQLAQHIIKQLCGWNVAENRIASIPASHLLPSR